MKKPENMSDYARICEECKANFKEEILLHPTQSEYQGHTNLRWSNPDQSGHITKVGNDFIHVWSAKEKDLAKIGGSGSLSMHRQNNKPPFTKLVAEVDSNGDVERISVAPEPFQYEQLDEHDRQTAEVILRQIFELKHLARLVARDYSPDDQNPASIGQTAKITLDALKAMRDKK